MVTCEEGGAGGRPSVCFGVLGRLVAEMTGQKNKRLKNLPINLTENIATRVTCVSGLPAKLLISPRNAVTIGSSSLLFY